MKVAQLMCPVVIACRPEDSLDSAASKLWDYDIGCLPVVDGDNRPVGMLTDRDVCMAAYTQDRPLGELEVNIAMARHPISVHSDQDIEEVERAMAEHQVRRIPVVDSDGKPVGVLSLNDLAIEAARPDTPMTDASSRVVHTLAAVSVHRRTDEPAPAADGPAGEIAPQGWFTQFYPYSFPSQADARSARIEQRTGPVAGASLAVPELDDGSGDPSISS